MAKPRPQDDYFRFKEPSPRVKLAAQLYGAGIVKTQAEASRAAGLSPNYLSTLMNNDRVRQLVTEAHTSIVDKTEDIQLALKELGRKGLKTIEAIMEDTQGVLPAVRLKAAIDLADRSNETTKIQKHQITSFSLDGDDVMALSKALVESSRTQERYRHEVQADFVRIDTTPETPTDVKANADEAHGASEGAEAVAEGSADEGREDAAA